MQGIINSKRLQDTIKSLKDSPVKLAPMQHTLIRDLGLMSTRCEHIILDTHEYNLLRDFFTPIVD